jgi:hypothetical protein
MGFNDTFLSELGSVLVNGVAIRPLYLAYDLGSSESNTGSVYLQNELPNLRKDVSWYFYGRDPSAAIVLETTDANGSSIYGFGLAIGSTSLGSDLRSRESSSIGYKDSSFIVTTTLSVKFQRG